MRHGSQTLLLFQFCEVFLGFKRQQSPHDPLFSEQRKLIPQNLCFCYDFTIGIVTFFLDLVGEPIMYDQPIHRPFRDKAPQPRTDSS